MLWRAMLVAASLALGGCAGLYFKDAGPAPAVRYELASLPYFGYWTGIVFNGEKVGFSHFEVRKEAGSPRYEIRSEATIVLRFLGLEKTILLRSRDLVNADLTLVELDYWFRVDDSELQVAGSRQGEELVLGKNGVMPLAPHHVRASLCAHEGWGHSDWRTGCEFAAANDIGSLWLFHHKPGRTDEELVRIKHDAKRIFAATEAAAEGDALGYLRSQADGSLGGLFAAQVVEHLDPPYLMRVLDAAYVGPQGA